jgi:1,4-dihydroxy-2-naphthoate polyprenyltransferase
MIDPYENTRPGSLNAWFLAVRPLTLPASIAPVILGWSLAATREAVPVDLGIACLAVALLLQVAANLTNDLRDARDGVDAGDRLGPRRVTQSGLLSPEQVTRGVAVCLVLAAVAGAYAVLHAGWWLLVLGMVCIVAAVAYTAGPWPLARLGLGEAAALVFFGPVAVTGTFAVLAGTVTPAAWVAGLVPGLHAGAIMAVNNLRDISSDNRAGKRTLAVRLGERHARLLAMGLVIMGNAVVVPLAWITDTPSLWLALLLLPLSAPLLRAMFSTPRSPALNGVLARTGQWELFTCLVIATLLQFGG